VQFYLWSHESKPVTTVQRWFQTSGEDLPYKKLITRWYMT